MPGSDDFLEAASRGVFLLRRCRECETVNSPDVSVCAQCHSLALDWSPASGSARLISWTVTHPKPPTPSRVLAVAELEEGPWWWADLEEADPAALAEGDTLAIAWRDSPVGRVPIFRPNGRVAALENVIPNHD